MNALPVLLLASTLISSTPQELHKPNDQHILHEDTKAKVNLNYKTKYTSNSVNFRQTPEIKEDNIIKLLPVNTKVKAHKFNDKWYKVEYKGQIGFIHKDYLSKHKVEIKKYSEDDLNLLARCIYAENGDSTDKALYYTGSVILNRVASKKYPNTIRGVIFAPHQYVSIGSRQWNKGADKRSKRIAKDLLENGSVLPSNVLYQAMFPQGKGTYAKIGSDYFCY